MVAGREHLAPTSTGVEVITRGYDALARHDEGALMEVLSDDVVLETAAQGVYHGPAGIRAWIADMDDAWSSWSVSIEELHDDGDHVIVDALLSGRSAYNDAELTQRFWVVWTIRDGKAVRGVHFAEKEQALAFTRSA
jgi:ketosteroid isomerase-like protein